MIVITIGKVPELMNFAHKCTTYKLFDTENVEDATPIAVWEKSKVFKNCLQENIDLDPDKKYFCKYTIHMGFKRLDPNTGEDDEYNEDLDGRCGTIEKVVPVQDVKHQTARMLLRNDVEIETPFINYDTYELKDPDSEVLTFFTSSFRGRGDSHKSTTWIIEDKFGNALLASLNDTKNKTTLVVNKEDIIKGHTSIKIRAFHESASGVASPPGELDLILGSHNFTIVSNTTNLSPTQDYPLILQRNDESKPTGIIKIEVKNHAEDETLWAINVLDQHTTNFILPWNLFGSGTTLMLCIHVSDENNVISTIKRRLVTRGVKVHDIESINNQHRLEVSATTTLLNKIRIPDHITTMQLRQGYYVPLPNGKDAKVHLFEYDTKTHLLKDTNKTLPGVSLITPECEDTVIRCTEDDYLVIDTLNEEKRPTFMVYKFDISRQTFSFLHSKVRRDETFTTGRNGSLIQVDHSSTFYYLPPNSGTIRKYDLLKNEISVLASSGIENPKNGVLIPMRNGRILIFAGDDFMSRKYIVAENRYVDGVSIRPQSFVGRELTAIQLNNGSSLIVKRGFDPDDDEISMLYFDYSLSEFKRLAKKFSEVDVPTSFIELLNGELILAKGVDERVVTPNGESKHVLGSLLSYFN